MKQRHLIQKIFVAVLVVGLLCSGQVHAQSNDPRSGNNAQTTRQVQQILAKYDANSLVVINKNRGVTPQYIAHQSTAVQAMPKRQRQAVTVTPNRLFPIASMQKVMTGIMTQQLVDQGRLKLTEKISRFYPHLPHAKKITVQGLMTHRSGIKDLSPKDSPNLLTKQSAQLTFTTTHLTSKGGSTWQYANANFTLLAGIVSSVTGQSYQERLTKLIISPLMEVHNMKFANRVNNSRRVVPVLPLSHWNFPLLQAAWSGSMGADEMLVTPAAYWKFLNVFSQGGFVPIKDYTSRRNLAPTNYYGGVYIRGNYLHSNGYSHGYASMFFTDYKSHRSIMLFSNNVPYSELKAMGLELFQAYYHRPYPLSTIGTV